jgi:hypothetical protein
MLVETEQSILVMPQMCIIEFVEVFVRESEWMCHVKSALDIVEMPDVQIKSQICSPSSALLQKLPG